MAAVACTTLYNCHIYSAMLMVITTILQTTSVLLQATNTSVTTNSPPDSLTTSSVTTTTSPPPTKEKLTQISKDVIYISGLSAIPINYSWVTPATDPSSYERKYLTPANFPNPRISPILCGRYDPSFFCDPSRNLTEAEGE